MCALLGITASGFYASRVRQASRRSLEDAHLTAQIEAVHRKSHQLYGSPRVTFQLRTQGVAAGRRRVARLMRQQRIQGRSARIYRRSRVAQKAFFRRFANIARHVTVTAPDQVWVGDVTYIRVAGRWRYLAVVMDKYSRRVLGWSLSSRRTSALTCRALANALRRRRPPAGVIFHSDRGIEYAAHDLGRRLTSNGFLQSMNRPHHMNDNAHMESFFHSLKSERLYGLTFATDRDLETELVRYMAFYNRVRLHSSLGYRSPVSFESTHLTNPGVN
jgi:transposase InsO family protein